MARDKFPMTSPEAQRLADSVDQGGEDKDSSWNSMQTQSAGNGPRANSNATDNASKALLGGEKCFTDSNRNSEEEDDEFLDRPTWEFQGSKFERAVWALRRFAYKQIYQRLYGDLPLNEMVRTLCLASTLFFMIGGYWLLRSLKDPIMSQICGVEYIPMAKMLSVFVVLAVVSVYNYFLDSNMPKHHLFYLFGSFYGCLFLSIALLLMHPTIGLQNQKNSPYRAMGWVSYCAIESFGSVMVSLYWSFANSNMNFETAKGSYGAMVAVSQIGSILGPTVVNVYADVWGVAPCYMAGALCMLFLQGTMFIYIKIYGASESTSTAPKPKKKRAGILEGVFLFIRYNYIKGIFAISCLFMVEVTIIDFTMKLLGKDYFAAEHPCQPGMDCWDSIDNKHGLSAEATAAFSKFMGSFGQATNSVSFIFSLVGTSAIVRRLGLRLTLLLFPSLCLSVIIVVRWNPTLYVVFGAMVVLKACSYALNNPTKEMLYQPTSSAVRYKAKSWIDIFGARGSKALGSIVTNAFSHSASELVANGSLVGIAVASFLIWNARFMGKKFDEYTESGYIVGQGEQGVQKDANFELIDTQQNGVEDTTCAVDDDDEAETTEQGDSGVATPKVQLV